MLNTYDLEELIDAVTKKIMFANRTGELENLMHEWGLDELIQKESHYETEKDGKIVVMGKSDIKIDKLYGIIKSLGLDKSRFEFCLDYDSCKTFNYRKMQFAPKYRVVMFGPLPHSTKGKKDSSSVIAEMKNNEGYPRVVTLDDGNELKITRNSFTKALNKLILEEYI